jgi:hypothetical protein
VKSRVARFFLVQHTKKRKNTPKKEIYIPKKEKIPKREKKSPKNHKTYQLLPLQDYPKVYPNTDFGLKICHLATLVKRPTSKNHSC